MADQIDERVKEERNQDLLSVVECIDAHAPASGWSGAMSRFSAKDRAERMRRG